MVLRVHTMWYIFLLCLFYEMGTYSTNTWEVGDFQKAKKTPLIRLVFSLRFSQISQLRKCWYHIYYKDAKPFYISYQFV